MLLTNLHYIQYIILESALDKSENVYKLKTKYISFISKKIAEVIRKKVHFSYCVKNEQRKFVETAFRQDTLLTQISTMEAHFNTGYIPFFLK